MRLIEDLLNISQIISGKFRIRCEWVDPIKIVSEAVENARSSAEAKGLDLRLEIRSGAGGLIFADPARLQQIMWNLLTNSVKFTSRGSIVTRVDRVGDRLQIEVEDTGEGISVDYLPHVFERFSQADSSTTRRYGGLGLGLSLVRQLVELQGGMVAARSDGLGRGSTFRITLPAPEAKGAVWSAKPPAASAPDSILAGVRILLVEDEQDAREMIAHALRGFGATVDQAASAAEALDKFAAAAPDVLVADIGMPIVDGYELMLRLRTKTPKLPPALALTAYASNSDIERALSAGFQAHAAKPVQLQSLVNTVADLAGRASRAS
jgi:CheY-like chemotaxis protein